MESLNETNSREAVGFGRISDDKQKLNASLETQSEEIRARAEKEGYKIIEIFSDEANSAYHKVVTKRQAMMDLLETVLSDQHEIEAVFFYDESRLSRQFYDFPLYIYDVIKREKPQVKFFSINDVGEWNPYNITNVMNFATAADFSVKLSGRVKAGQKNALSKQERPGSTVCYGYNLIYPEFNEETNKRRIKGEQIINPNTASIVLFIFYLSSWGHSQDRIATLLNEAQIPSPRGKEWSSGTIDYILDNDNYLGHLPWNIRTHLNTSRKKQRGEYDLIYNHHDPIINVLLWNITHQSIEMHKKNGKNNNTQFFLRGLLYCHNCNQELGSKNETPKNAKKNYLFYRCPTCKHKVKLEEIHAEIIKELSSKWVTTVLQMNNQIPKLLAKRKRKIIEHRDNIKEQLKLITTKAEFLVNQPNLVNDNSNWDFVLSISKSKIKNELAKANSFIEHIELLEQDTDSDRIYELLLILDLKHLKTTELRTLLLTLYKQIKINFEKDSLVYIEYKLAPFSAIDQYFETL